MELAAEIHDLIEEDMLAYFPRLRVCKPPSWGSFWGVYCVIWQALGWWDQLGKTSEIRPEHGVLADLDPYC